MWYIFRGRKAEETFATIELANDAKRRLIEHPNWKDMDFVIVSEIY